MLINYHNFNPENRDLTSAILFSGKTELQEQWNSDNKRPLFAMDFPLFYE
jgi:hypothetical protein